MNDAPKLLNGRARVDAVPFHQPHSSVDPQTADLCVCWSLSQMIEDVRTMESLGPWLLGVGEG